MNKKSLCIGIVVTLIGLLVLIIPRQCVKAIVVLLGIEAIINGVYCLTFTRKLVPDSLFQYAVILRAMLGIVVGLIAALFPLRFADKVGSAMLIILGLYLLFSAVLEIFAIGKLRDTEVDRKNFISEIVLSILVAFVLFVISANMVSFLRLVGALTSVIGGLYLFLLWKNRSIVQEPVEVVDDITGTIGKSGE